MYGLYKHCEGDRLTICSGQWKFSFQELTYLWYSVFWYSKRKQNNQHPHPRWATTHNGLEFNWSQWTGHSSFCFNWKTLILIWNLLNKSSQIYWETLLSSRDLPSLPCSSFWFMGENFIGSVLLCKYLQAFNWVFLIMFYFHSSGLNKCTCSAKLSFATLWRKLKLSSPNLHGDQSDPEQRYWAGLRSPWDQEFNHCSWVFLYSLCTFGTHCRSDAASYL